LLTGRSVVSHAFKASSQTIKEALGGTLTIVKQDRDFEKAAPRLELGVKVLQTSALPLGYAAIGLFAFAIIANYLILFKY
jgi:hypothetical protein